MSSQERNIFQLTDHLFRHEAGRMVAILTRIFGLNNLELAEDVVQDAFGKALKDWTYKIPENPSAWLMLTAKNKAIDIIRRKRHFKEFSKEISTLLKSEYTASSMMNELFLEHEIQDSQLRMIFACCHPELSETDQIALTLKTCSAFSINEIAGSLLTNYEGIKKRLHRAKNRIKEKNIQFEIPSGNELRKRLDIVTHVIYLIFNEGYNSSSKESLIRKDLCEEAIRLAILLTENDYTNHPKCFALVSLMYLLASRFEARVDEKGEIILLEDQNRNKWNNELISVGMKYLGESARGDELSEYHLEAAIVSEHTLAKSIEETDWKKILFLYDRLLKINKSPVIKLNRAIVLSKINGPKRGIEEINLIKDIKKIMASNYLFTATLGELHKQLNEYEIAKIYFEKATNLTSSPIEKKLLIKKAQKCIKETFN